MTESKKRYGYTGKGLRVDLTTGKITVVPTFPKFDGCIGGTDFGYKTFWDEVPPSTKFTDPENKVVIAPGPLGGTGALCAGRTAMTTLWPTSWPQSLIATAHVGGDLGPKMKYAGFDFIIIEGESAKPVYLRIENEKAELRSAAHVWGQGTRRSASILAQDADPGASIGVIGPAGENLVPMSNMMVDKSHSAGGVGSIFGRKKFKGFVIYGDQAIHIHASPKDWEALTDEHRKLFGAHTQTVIPRIPTPHFDFFSPGSRWAGEPGKVYGSANPKVTLTDAVVDPHDLNHIAYRSNTSSYYLGEGLWSYTVRNTGCYACPIRCYAVMRDDETAAKYNISPITEQTCMALYGRWWFPSLVAEKKKPIARECNFVGTQTMDDLGIWCNYGCLQRDFRFMYTKGYWKKFLPEEEYKSIDWSKIDNPDPRILLDLLPRIAYRKGEFGRWLGETTPKMLEHFGIDEKEWQSTLGTNYWAVGHPKHHSNEDDGQAGCVLNCLWNRDPMCHGGVNYTRSGLPVSEQKRIAAVFWGDESAVDGIGDYTPTNVYKMTRLRWIVARKELHDMIGICSWTAPWELSPLREKQYIGDNEMESKVFEAVTGIRKTQEELDRMGLRSFILQRLYTMRQLRSADPRHDHDKYPEWIFMDKKNKDPFTKGTIRMERSDIEKSFDLFYELMDFDKATGAPTKKCLEKYNLGFAAETMAKEGLALK